MVTAMDGKPKPLLAPGGRTTSMVLPSSQVRARPKASAASQCAAAIHSRRQANQASTARQAGASTGQSPSEASAAIGWSASGLRRASMAWCTARSRASGSPWPITTSSSTNQAQPMAISSTASRAREVDSRWLGSNTAAEWRPTTGCRWLQSRARASSESAWPANQR